MHHLGTGDHRTPTGLRRLPLGLVAMFVTVVAIEKYEVRRGCALSGCLAPARETTAKGLKREHASAARGQARVDVEGVVALSTSLESLADSSPIGMTGSKTARC
jgi:hypothetical protein